MRGFFRPLENLPHRPTGMSEVAAMVMEAAPTSGERPTLELGFGRRAVSPGRHNHKYDHHRDHVFTRDVMTK